MHTTTKILLIEDNRNITDALVQALQTLYEVDTAASGKLGIYKSDREQYAAILLDLNLPDVQGVAVCQQLRERGVTAPILVVTAEYGVMSKIRLLDAGANDYLTKPFSLGELKARLRCLIRTNENSLPQVKSLQVGSLLLNTVSHEVVRDGTPICLRRKEFAMLECLMTYQGNVVSRDALTRYAWNGNEKNWTNTVDVHIKHLRDKVDRPFELQMIKTVHGVGYKIEYSVTAALPSDSHTSMAAL